MPLMQFLTATAKCANNHESQSVATIIGLLSRPSGNYDDVLTWMKSNSACPTCKNSDHLTLEIYDPGQ